MEKLFALLTKERRLRVDGKMMTLYAYLLTFLKKNKSVPQISEQVKYKSNGLKFLKNIMYMGTIPLIKF